VNPKAGVIHPAGFIQPAGVGEQYSMEKKTQFAPPRQATMCAGQMSGGSNQHNCVRLPPGYRRPASSGNHNGARMPKSSLKSTTNKQSNRPEGGSAAATAQLQTTKHKKQVSEADE